jgi:dTDP-4-amino-4,6-dideoxygalactose transaminase
VSPGAMGAARASVALNAGEPVRRVPFSPWPVFEADEIEAASAVLRSGKVNYWTGEQGQAFEREFASFVGCRHGIALANGTVGLELALFSLGIGPGAEVIVPSRTFVATASSVVLRGATPVFADVDADSGNLTAATIRPLINEKTKAIIAVHLGGWPCEMDAILDLASNHGLRVIEDCAQAHGATYQGRPVGSMSEIGVFSFCQDKIVSTGGEGGMLTTNDQEVWNLAWSYKDHGKSYSLTREQASASYLFRWVHERCGTNWRMTEMQSAIGRVLTRKIQPRVEVRRRNAGILIEGLSHIDALRVPVPPPHAGHAYYRFYAFVRPDRLRDGWNRDRIVEAINAEGIPCFVGSCSEIYLEEAFASSLRPKQRASTARAVGETSLMFLVHPTLSEQDMLDTCRGVDKVMAVAAK